MVMGVVMGVARSTIDPVIESVKSTHRLSA